MSNATLSIQPLLDRLREGGPEAREARNQLIRHARERFHLRVRRMLREYPGLRQWEDTSDVLQKVLLRIDNVLISLDVPTPLDFLRLSACQIRRELIDLTRHYFGPEGDGTHQFPPGLLGQEAMPDPADRREDPYHLARWSELHKYIAGLSEDERELFDLLYYQGLGIAEAAVLLGMAERTLRRHWLKAQIDLSTHLGDDFEL